MVLCAKGRQRGRDQGLVSGPAAGAAGVSHLFFDSEALSLSSHGNVVIDEVFIARERRWSQRPLSLCRVCLSSQISILARCEIQVFEAERLAFVCDSVNYVLTSSVQF